MGKVIIQKYALLARQKVGLVVPSANIKNESSKEKG
jgi:hypothetical protein